MGIKQQQKKFEAWNDRDNEAAVAQMVERSSSDQKVPEIAPDAVPSEHECVNG